MVTGLPIFKPLPVLMKLNTESALKKRRDIGQMHVRQNNINTNILVVMTLNVISIVIDYIYKVIVI
jgi:hypothetical protein